MAITLTQDQLNELRNSKRLAIEALSDLDKAERAGLDVKEKKAELKDQLSRVEQILSVYG